MKKLLLSAFLLLTPTLGFCDSKISAMPSTTTLNSGDIIPVVTNPSGSALNMQISKSNLITTLGITGGSSGGIISPGTFTWTNNFGISASTVAVSTLNIIQNGAVPLPQPSSPINMVGNTNSPLVEQIQNFSNGASASGDISLTSNLGGFTSYYAVLGITSNNFNETGLGINIFRSTATFLYSSDEDLVLAADLNGTDPAANLILAAGLNATQIGALEINNNNAIIAVSSMTFNGLIGQPVTSVSASYAITSTDTFIMANAASAGLTVTLPTAVGLKGSVYRIKKTDSTGNQVTVATTSSQTIDGALTQILYLKGTDIEVVSDNANWNIE